MKSLFLVVLSEDYGDEDSPICLCGSEAMAKKAVARLNSLGVRKHKWSALTTKRILLVETPNDLSFIPLYHVTLNATTGKLRRKWKTSVASWELESFNGKDKVVHYFKPDPDGDKKLDELGGVAKAYKKGSGHITATSFKSFNSALRTAQRNLGV